MSQVSHHNLVTYLLLVIETERLHMVLGMCQSDHQEMEENYESLEDTVERQSQEIGILKRENQEYMEKSSKWKGAREENARLQKLLIGRA